MLGSDRPFRRGPKSPSKEATMRTLILIATPACAADWVDSFDGKALHGWRQHNGTATYRVVGATAETSPNSFVCTTTDYGDFEWSSTSKSTTGSSRHLDPRPRAREDCRRGAQQSPRQCLRPPSRKLSQRRGRHRSRLWLERGRREVRSEHRGAAPPYRAGLPSFFTDRDPELLDAIALSASAFGICRVVHCHPC